MATLYIVNSNFVPYFFSKDIVCNSSCSSSFAICATDFKFKEQSFTSMTNTFLEYEFVQVYLGSSEVRLQPINWRHWI